ncbi:MAG: hypothetical protein EOP17_00355 [Rhizobiaceae bacterium]|nr:MAG: hypothetical protein EOP17_00355 [Rhizobiaceae bacterium]
MTGTFCTGRHCAGLEHIMNDPRAFEGDYNSDDEEILPEANEDELEEDEDGEAVELGREDKQDTEDGEEDDDDEDDGA